VKRRTGNYAGEDRVRKRGYTAWADKQRGPGVCFGNSGCYSDNTAVFEVCERVISAGVQGGV